MGHATNWTDEEDVFLAESWVGVSNDPIKSNQQTGETFWERIFARFSSKMQRRYGEQAASHRTVTAVQNRWSSMNHDINKFVGCLAQVKAVSKSGYGEEDYITDALATYRADRGKPFRFLRAWECVKDDPKWKADGGLLRDKKMVKKCEDGKQQAKKARLELEEVTVDPNVEEDFNEENNQQTDKKFERPIGIKAAKAAIKAEKKDNNMQLEVDRQIAAAQRDKAEAAQTQARTTRDEFLLKLIAFNPDTAEAKEWMALKIAEAVTEAKEMKIKKEKELEALEEEMARSKKPEKTLKPARFVHTNSIVASGNVTLDTVSSLSLQSDSDRQQRKQNVCCAGDFCFVSNGHRVVCGMTCRVCTKPCHSDCCDDDEYGFKICTQCAKVQASDEV